MNKEPLIKRKMGLIFIVLFLLLFFSFFTNPTKEDYMKFDRENTGIPIPENVRIAEADFIFFSIFASAPENTLDEYGMAHLGFMGHFFKVTDGQYDESIWENFLK